MIAIILPMVLSSLALAKPTCYSNSELTGRSELMTAFQGKQFVDFHTKFKKFCDVNKAKIVCQASEVKLADVKQKELALVGDNKCAQSMSVPSGENTVVYFYNEK